MLQYASLLLSVDKANNVLQPFEVSRNRPRAVFIDPSSRVTATKIDNPRIALDVNQHVGGLGIAPDNVPVVQRTQSLLNLAAPSLPGLPGRLRADKRVQRALLRDAVEHDALDGPLRILRDAKQARRADRGTETRLGNVLVLANLHPPQVLADRLKRLEEILCSVDAHSGRVVVADPAGRVAQHLDLGQGEDGEKKPRRVCRGRSWRQGRGCLE